MKTGRRFRRVERIIISGTERQRRGDASQSCLHHAHLRINPLGIERVDVVAGEANEIVFGCTRSQPIEPTPVTVKICAVEDAHGQNTPCAI